MQRRSTHYITHYVHISGNFHFHFYRVQPIEFSASVADTLELGEGGWRGFELICASRPEEGRGAIYVLFAYKDPSLSSQLSQFGPERIKSLS